MARKNTKAKKKAYNYSSAKSANSAGFTTKQYKDSVRGKKAWDNKSRLEKEVTIERLRNARRVRRNARRREDAGMVEAYEIVSQSHYDARGKTPKGKKYHTLFEYTTNGYFQYEPSVDKLETMTKNSLISAFNNGKGGKGGYLKSSAFNKIVDNNLRGIKIQKVRVPVEQVNNRMSAELSITNQWSKYKWTGKN
jgi:hypothetical protein